MPRVTRASIPPEIPTRGKVSSSRESQKWETIYRSRKFKPFKPSTNVFELEQTALHSRGTSKRSVFQLFGCLCVRRVSGGKRHDRSFLISMRSIKRRCPIGNGNHEDRLHVGCTSYGNNLAAQSCPRVRDNSALETLLTVATFRKMISLSRALLDYKPEND